MASLSLATLVASFFAIGVAQAETFPDVQPSDWFYSYVEDLVALGVVNGSMPEYRPGDNVNRAEMAKLVVEAFDIDLVSPDEATFKDVASGTWYYEYVETAAAHGIVGGYKDDEGALTGYYGPADAVTREQTAKMIVLGAPLELNTNCGPSFPDVGVNRWSYEFVETLYVNSVVDGYPDGTFGSEASINRAEIAKIVSNGMAPMLRSCGGFSVASADAMSATTAEVCFTGDYDETSAMMPENYVVEDGNGDELAVTNVEATSDPMCALLTTDAQDSTKVYDLLVSDVMSVDGQELLSGEATFDGYTVGATGDLTVRLDGSSPEPSDIPNNGSNILFSVFNFEAGADEDVRIEELTISRAGLGLPGDFDSVKLYVDGVQTSSEKTINSSTNAATFTLSGDPIMVPAGSSVLIEARGDMAGLENSQNALCVGSSDDILAYGDSTNEELPVDGDFAVCGDYMTTTSAQVGGIDYEVNDYTGEVEVGDEGVSVARLKLDVTNKEDVDVTRISFKQRGSADAEDFANTTLYLSGSPLDVEGEWEGDFLTFDLSEDPIYIERGNSRTLELRVDIAGGLGNDLLFDIYRDWHIEGVGKVYHYGVNVSEVDPAPALAQREIVGGNLAFALSSNNPTVGDVMAGAQDFVFMAYNMSTGGDGVTMRSFDLTVNVGGGVGEDCDNLEDLKVWRENTAGDLVVVAGPLDPADACGGGTDTLTFNDTFDQTTGDTVEYFVTADVANDAPNDAQFEIVFDTSTVDAEYLSNGDAVAAGDISGGTMTGKVQTVADPTLTVDLSTIPSDQNIVGGKQDVEVANWSIQASSASDIKVTSLTLTCDWTDNGGDAEECTDVFSNLDLYQKDGSTYTLLEGNESLSTGVTATAVFNNVNLTIPAGETVKVALRTDTTTSGDNTDTADWNIAAAADVVAEDQEFNTLATGQKTVDASLRTVSFVGAGTLTISLSGSSPTDDALLGGAEDNDSLIVKFEADENEDIEIQKLRLYNDGAADDEAVSSITLYDGADPIGTASLTGTSDAEFVGLSVVVPADGQKLLTAVVDTNNIRSSGADSGMDYELNFNDVTVGVGDTFDNDGVDIKAVGESSGEDVGLIDNVTAATPGNFVIYNTLPTLSRTDGSPTSGGGTNVSMLEFDLAVDGPVGDSGVLEEVEVSFSGTCTTPPTDFRLFRGNTEIGDSSGDLVLAQAEFNNTIGEEVTTGNVATLNIHADTTGCATDESLIVNVESFDYNDGEAVYTADTTNNYLYFDSSPYPLAGNQFNF